MPQHERPLFRSRRAEEGVRHGVYGNMRRPMAVLTHDVILQEINSGRLVIDPFESDQVGAASIDLTLADEIRVLEPGGVPIDVLEDSDHRELTRVKSLTEPFLLEPGATIHGLTLERVSLPSDLCGFLEGRSRFARLGLMIHVTSAMVQPGVCNRQVLEMSNVSGHPLRIFAGVRICQLVLMRTEGEAVYRGRFSDQETV
jgi:dCTP deaminase